MKVNILMSTYNGERFIREQLESIIQQTYTDWTLLIRDDGSTDRTTAIIEEYVARDARIRWINQGDVHNLGVIQSFFTLVKTEPADLYFFSDQDDVWLPDKLQICLEKANGQTSHQPLLVYTDLKVVNQSLEVINDSMIKSQSHHANTTLLQELTENTVTGGTMMINHALAERWTETDQLLMHDWYLALLAAAFGKLVYIDQPTELYRQHENNVLGARTWKKRVAKWMRPHLLFQKYWELIKRSQEQAKNLLTKPDLSKVDRQLVEDYVTILDQPLAERYRIMRKHSLRKNKWFHTVVFRTLILTKFGYKE